MATHTRYFNFPVCLLDNFLIDTPYCLKNIFDYSIYSNSLKQYSTNELERISISATYFGIRLNNIASTYKNGKTLFNSINENTPKTGINIDVFFDYYVDKKTEYEKVCLLAHLALKSIIQKKTYTKLDNKYWLSRMAGFSKSKELELLPPELIKYANEYQTKKIKNELRNNWGLITYSRYNRGFYISYKLKLKELVYEVEKRRKSNKDKINKIKENEAVKEALQRLQNE